MKNHTKTRRNQQYNAARNGIEGNCQILSIPILSANAIAQVCQIQEISDRLWNLTEEKFIEMKDEYNTMVSEDPEKSAIGPFDSSTMTFEEFRKKYGDMYEGTFRTEASSYYEKDPKLWKYTQTLHFGYDTPRVSDVIAKRKTNFIEKRKMLGDTIDRLEKTLQEEKEEMIRD